MLKLLLVLLVSPCSMATDAPVGTEFTLKKNEKASVKGTSIAIKVISAGTAQHESGGDSVFCDAEVKADGRSRRLKLDVGEIHKASGHKIKLTSVDIKTDPKLADPWSNVSCTFVVTQGEK